jgi:Fic/DOC family
MAKGRAEADLDRIADILSRHARGLSVSEIEIELAGQVTHRTLARRLARLVAANRIERRGIGKGTRYFALARVADSPAGQTSGGISFEAPSGSVAISLSSIAKDQLDYVSRPLLMRPPIGYRRALLDDYIPNRSEYLPDSLKAKLHRIGRPIDAKRVAGTFARDILNRLLIDLSWASSRLEGNTYSRLDTQRLIDFGQAADGKDSKETQMILNHKAAIEMVVEGGEDIGINRYTILNLHTLLSDELMADPEASGRLRRRPVEIGKSVYTPLAVPQLVEECFNNLLSKGAAILDPFEQAFFLMVHIPYLQPFEDVNKRVSRLAANLPLVGANLCPLSFIDVPENAYFAGTLAVYEMTRTELLRDIFEWAYARSCQQYIVVRDSLIEPDLFRMKHKAALIDVIGDVVRSGTKPTLDRIQILAQRSINPGELPRFVQLASQEIARLSEGNIARYRIKRSEFRIWQAKSALVSP